ncbi:MAG TPA: hypothetical protein VLQ93_16605 [Myxococcaceae bacterium]|nr:hypothetical protein [Myxococcaceae bacterium]
MQRLVARKVEKLLEALAAQVARGRTGEEVPSFTLTLHLAHGHQLTGVLVDYVPREAVLLATTKEGLLSRTESVSYVDLTSVVAVTLGSPARLSQLPMLMRPALGREDLLRHGERLARALTEQFWPAEEQLGGQILRYEVEWKGLDDEPGRRALEEAMNAVTRALRLLGEERNGRDNLRRIARIQFTWGKQMGLTLQGETGRMTVDPAAPAPHVQALRKALALGR